MDWFRVDSDLPRHPHLLRVARRLSITKTQAMGHLLALWCAVAEHAENGDLRAVDDELVELYAEWPDSRRGEFVGALNEVGWIDTKRQLSGWAKRHEYMLRERKRKIDERRNWRESKGKRSRTVRAPSDEGCAHHPADGARCPPPDGAQPTVPNRTVPDRTIEVPKDTVATAPAAKTQTPKKPKPDVQAAIDAYHDAHLAATSEKPVIAGGQIGKLAKAALGCMSLDDLRALLPIYFAEAAAPSASDFFASYRLEKLRAARRANPTASAAPDAQDRKRARRVALCHLWAKHYPYPAWVHVPAVRPEPFYARVFGALDDMDIRRYADDRTRQSEFFDVELRDAADRAGIADADLPKWFAENVRSVAAPQAEARSA